MRTRVRPAGYRPAVHPRKLLARIGRGSLANVRFEDMRRLVEAFGFRLERVHGSHIFAHSKFPELLNLQEVEGEAKPYQIRQFLRLAGRYALILEDES